jgi:cytidylate kinase
VDGPAGAGKSTIAKLVARELGYTYIDTGAMYRAVTLKALNKQVDLEDEDAFSFIKDTTLSFKDGHLFMDGKDVSHDVRKTEISNNVSLVSSYLSVRQALVSIQQQIAENHNIVMDGRDIGTNVLPQATYKFFLTASIEERAKRRHEDNIQRGIESNIKQLLEEITRRDYLDTTREHSPLRPASDARIIDTSHMSIDDVVHLITTTIREVE